MTGSFIAWAVAAAALAAAGQLLFKLGASGRESPIDFINASVLAGLVLYGVGTVLWLVALSRASLNAVYPFALLTLVLVGLGSALLLKEPVPMQTGIGWLVVLIGLAVIALDR